MISTDVQDPGHESVPLVEAFGGRFLFDPNRLVFAAIGAQLCVGSRFDRRDFPELQLGVAQGLQVAPPRRPFTPATVLEIGIDQVAFIVIS